MKDGTGEQVDNLKTVRLLSSFVVPYWKSIGLAVLFLLGETAMELLKPWPLKWSLDVILRQSTLHGSTLYLLIAVSTSVLAIAALGGLCSYLGALYLNRVGRTVVFDLRAALFDRIQRLSLQFHSHRFSGDLLTRVTSDVKALRDVLTDSFAEVTQSILLLIAMGGVLLWLDWQLALVVISGSAVLFLVLRRYTSQIQDYSRAERKREGALASVVHESLETTRLSRAFNQEEPVRHKFQTESQASLESGLAAAVTAERFSWAVDVLGAAVTAVVLGFGVQRVMAGAITAGTLVVFVTYVRNFYKPLRTAIRHSNKITRAAAQAERVVELLGIEEGVRDLPGADHAPQFRGLIEFREVDFAYEFEQSVLKGIDLVVPAGQVTAIVGPTGAGKSTLASLIPRLYDPTRGAVLIDGRDIRRFTVQSLRSQISVMFQESVLLHASIAENIAYGRLSATPQDILAAARNANAHDFIVAFPQGYDTEVGERGETLSGGQRQRIAIARAMVRDAPIVILDEPLTGLDAASAAAVMQALGRLMRERTVIIITHDLSIVQRADHVVVLADGQIVQQGDHRGLLEVQGTYRDLCQTQFRDVPVPQLSPISVPR